MNTKKSPDVGLKTSARIEEARLLSGRCLWNFAAGFTMTRIVEKTEEMSTNRVMGRYKRQSLNNSQRSATDAPWRIVFFVVFVFWIIGISYTISVQQQPGAITISSENSTKSHNSSELVAPYFLWGRHWAFDAITGNAAFLQAHYDESGVIVIATNLLFSIGLFVYSIGPRRKDGLFHWQLDYAALLFSVIFVPFRLVTLKKGNTDWLITEAMFFIIWYTKRQYADERKIRYIEGQLPLQPMHQNLLLTITMLHNYVIASLYVLHDRNSLRGALSYAIFAAGIYVALTFYYFMLIVLAYVADQSMDMIQEDRDSEYAIFQSVWRYHLGTACYHATLIFPRLKTLAVMNEPEFKEMLSDGKLVDRLALTQGRLHDLSLVGTAVASTDHAESLRELLRHWHTAGPRDFKYFGGYAQILRSSLALLLSTKNLKTLFFWSRGTHAPHTELVTWKHFLLCIVIFGGAMRTSDIVMDTMLLHSKDLSIR